MYEGTKTPEMPSQRQVLYATEAFRLLADGTRIKILWTLLQRESSVAELAEMVGASATAVSQHLSKLRLAHLVRVRRVGTFAFYSAADNHVARLLSEALYHADHREGPSKESTQEIFSAATDSGGIP